MKLKPRGRAFPKGVSPNPAGRTPVPKEIKEARLTHLENFNRCVNKFASMDVNGLRDFLRDGASNVGDALIATCFSKALSGSYQHATLILDRTVGVVPRSPEIQINTQVNVEQNNDFKMSKENRDTMLMHMLKLRKEPGEKLCRLTQNSLELSPPSEHPLSPPPSDMGSCDKK